MWIWLAILTVFAVGLALGWTAVTLHADADLEKARRMLSLEETKRMLDRTGP